MGNWQLGHMEIIGSEQVHRCSTMFLRLKIEAHKHKDPATPKGLQIMLYTRRYKHKTCKMIMCTLVHIYNIRRNGSNLSRHDHSPHQAYASTLPLAPTLQASWQCPTLEDDAGWLNVESKHSCFIKYIFIYIHVHKAMCIYISTGVMHIYIYILYLYTY